MQVEHVVFAIDNNTDFHAVAKFMRQIDTARAMNKLEDGVAECVGMWEGILETSYLMSRRDYEKVVLPLGVTQNQESVLVVPSSVRQPCHYAKPDLTYLGSLGPMRSSKTMPVDADGWTFNKVNGLYFTC